MDKKKWIIDLYSMTIAVLVFLYATLGDLIYGGFKTNDDYEFTLFAVMGLIVFSSLFIAFSLVGKKYLTYKRYLIATLIIKIGLIPFYIWSTICIVLSLLMVAIPFVGIIMAIPMLITLPTVGYLFLLMGSTPQIVLIKKLYDEGIITKEYRIVLIIASFFFVTDLVAALVCNRCVKNCADDSVK